MLLQKLRNGKTAVLVTILIILGLLIAMPLLLQADATGEADGFLFLPMIYNQVETDGTPNPITESTATPTFTASPTIHPAITASATPSYTATPSPTSTPVEPYILAVPNCGPGPNIQFNFQAYNWPVDQSVTFFWQGVPQGTFQANMHTGSFNMTWSFDGLTDGIYMVSAQSGISGATASNQIYIPCGILPTNTPTPTSISTSTNTPAPQPADLVVGQPQLISTPPIIVYQPLAFEVPITNTGDININTLFFVDLLFSPPPGHIEDSYTAVSSLAGGSTITLTITSTIGLANFLGDHQVTALVDSLDHVIEVDETNNLSAPFEITIAEPAMTPNYTATPTGGSTISGTAMVLWNGNLLPQERMHISAIEEATGQVIAVTYSDENGFYQFNSLTEGVAYTVQGCITIDNNAYFGIRTNQTPPNAFVAVFALQSSSCP